MPKTYVYDVVAAHDGDSLARDAGVVFKIPKNNSVRFEFSPGCLVEAKIEHDGRLVLYVPEGRLVVRPQTSNSVEIAVDRRYARARRA